MAPRGQKAKRPGTALKEPLDGSRPEEESRRARRALRPVVVLYLFLACVYAVAIPAGKGPDETAHLRYVSWLADHHTLPVFAAVDPGADYEFHQPPLYYALALPVYLAAGGEPRTGGQGVRFFTAMIGLLLVYLTFALGRALVPERPWAAVGAAGVVGLLPMQVHLATTVGNDVLTEVLVAAALLLLIRHLQAAAQTDRESDARAPGAATIAGAGILAGLGLLTKSISIVMLPVIWLGSWLAARHGGTFAWRRLGRDLLLATALAAALGGWWLARNQVLYGDLLGQRAFVSAFEDRPSPQWYMARYHVPLPFYLIQVTLLTCASALGMFGPVRGNQFVFFPVWVYVLVGLLALFGAIGFLRHLRRTRLNEWQRQGWWLCLALFVLLAVGFVRFNFSFFQAQARYLFPALPAAALALALGLEEFVPVRWRAAAMIALPLALAALSLTMLPLWIVPQFLSP